LTKLSKKEKGCLLWNTCKWFYLSADGHSELLDSDPQTGTHDLWIVSGTRYWYASKPPAMWAAAAAIVHCILMLMLIGDSLYGG